MEKSYHEIFNILSLLKRDDLKGMVKKGSPEYLPSETGPVDSPATFYLVELTICCTEDRPLYVSAIGAMTTVASSPPVF
jgi:hypothetical protein